MTTKQIKQKYIDIQKDLIEETKSGRMLDSKLINLLALAYGKTSQEIMSRLHYWENLFKIDFMEEGI